jgi:hypothetical protein|eukprot:COSAG06_NODE_23444_length_692_cov_1.927365_2_plen_106_part_00
MPDSDRHEQGDPEEETAPLLSVLKIKKERLLVNATASGGFPLVLSSPRQLCVECHTLATLQGCVAVGRASLLPTGPIEIRSVVIASIVTVLCYVHYCLCQLCRCG